MKLRIKSVMIVGTCLVSMQVAFGVQVRVLDFMSHQAASVSDVASALGLRVDGQVTSLFTSESLTATLGPTGAGKSTLLGGHGFAAGDKLTLTNAGGGKLQVQRSGSGSPLSVFVHMDEFWIPQALGEVNKQLGLKSSSAVNGLLKGMSMTTVFAGSKSSPLAAKGFSPGDTITLTNIGGGTLEALRTEPGTPLSIHIHMDKSFSPQTLNEMTQVLGLKIQGKARKLATNESLSASVTTTAKSTLLSTKGFSAGDNVKITNAGGGKMQIERIGPGSRLSIFVHMDDFYSPQLLNETAKALGMKLQGRATLMAPNMAMEAIVGAGGSGKSTLISKKGFRPQDKVRLTNAGGGKLKIERISGGAPLTIDIIVEDFYAAGPVVR
ncbi:MAG: hypothetical protein JXM79_20670 [Sedimentisphaerales bacterium]|nr:hypothetical protein [Sedimentisphaerales bacterium]